MAIFILYLLFCWPEKLKHKNNNINFLVAKTCTTIKHCNPAAPSISYVINPDGSEGLAPFVVSCSITDKKRVGVTIVSHATALKQNAV